MFTDLRRNTHVGDGGVTEEARRRWYRDGADKPELMVKRGSNGGGGAEADGDVYDGDDDVFLYI